MLPQSIFPLLIALFCGFSASANDWTTALTDAPIVFAAKTTLVEMRFNTDSSYLYKVQTLRVIERLRGSERVRKGVNVEMWYPLGRVLRYADGSFALPEAAHDAEGLAFASADYSIYFCTKIDTRRKRTIQLQPFLYTPEGISIFGYQKAHQRVAVAGFDAQKYATIPVFVREMAHYGLKISTSPTILRQNAFPTAHTNPQKKGSLAAVQTANNSDCTDENDGDNSTKAAKNQLKIPFEFYPKSIIAGSDEVLTITATKGNEFGKKRGEIFFTNAEMGLCNDRFYTNYCDTTDILEWTPTRIRMRVPSYIISATYNEHAGTGPFIVKTHPSHNRYFYGAESLFIPYSFVNEPSTKKTTQKERWYFANYRCQKGLSFAIDTTNIHKLTRGHRLPRMYRDSLIFAIKAAVHQWSRHLPGVSITVADAFVTQKELTDRNIRLISFNDDVQQPMREMFSYTRTQSFAASRQAKSNFVSVRSILEINVRAALTKEKMEYWVDTTMLEPKPAHKRDFYVTILHEIGHLLGLNHTLNDSPDEPRDLMSIYSCSAKEAIFAYDRPSLQYQNCHAVQGAQQVLYNSRRLDWSDKQEQVVTLGSNITPQQLTLSRQPKANLFCTDKDAEILKYEVLPYNKTYAYEWQYNSGKRGWFSIPTDDASFGGQRTNLLRSRAQIGAYNGKMREFRCVVSSDGCSAISEVVGYRIGLKQPIEMRSTGVSVSINTPIELPKGYPQDGVYEGKGVTGGGGQWYFTPYTVGSGYADIVYKTRKPQASPTNKNKYCTYTQAIKVITTAQARRALPTHTTDLPKRMTIRPEQPLRVAVKIDGAGNYLPDNVFKIQLSDRNGDFLTAYEDDTDNLPNIVANIKNPLSANIAIELPVTLASGKHYRIRVIETAPFRVGADNGFDITVRNLNLHEEDVNTKDPIFAIFKKR